MSIGTAIVASSVVAVLSSVPVPPLAITCVSSIATLSSALSIKFNLKDRKNKLEKSIQELHKIKDKLDYVISCNDYVELGGRVVRVLDSGQLHQSERSWVRFLVGPLKIARRSFTPGT